VAVLRVMVSRYCVLGDVRGVGIEQLQHLALGDAVGGFGHHPHDRHAVDFHHHLEGARVQKISHQHAGLVAPHGVGRGVATAQVGGVHHVVVQQGGGMDEFQDRRQHHRIVAGTIEGLCAEQQGYRTQPLAAAVDDMGGEALDQDDVRVETLLDFPVHRGHLGIHQCGGCFEQGSGVDGFGLIPRRTVGVVDGSGINGCRWIHGLWRLK
jgi:hypothetical protein